MTCDQCGKSPAQHWARYYGPHTLGVNVCRTHFRNAAKRFAAGKTVKIGTRVFGPFPRPQEARQVA